MLVWILVFKGNEYPAANTIFFDLNMINLFSRVLDMVLMITLTSNISALEISKRKMKKKEKKNPRIVNFIFGHFVKILFPL